MNADRATRPFGQDLPPTGGMVLDDPVNLQVVDPATPLQAALWWLHRGETPIPIRAGTKRPPPRFALKSLLDGHRPRETEVARWWERWPNAQVGLVLGRSLVVVDTDSDEAESMVAGLNLPITAVVRTPRGRHRYFCVDEPVRTRVLKASIELRGTRSYVLVPPSVHPTGIKYTWEIPPSEPFARLPAKILGLFRDAGDGGDGHAGGRDGVVRAGSLPVHLQEALRDHPRLHDAFEGKINPPHDQTGSARDLVLTHLARKIGLSEADAIALMCNSKYPKRNPRTEKYIDRTLAKVYRRRPVGKPEAKTAASGGVPRVAGRLKNVGAKAALLYNVLREKMVPSRDVRVLGVVREGRGKLRERSGLSDDGLTRAGSKLEKAGFILRKRWRGGTNIFLLDPTYTAESAAQVNHQEAAEVPGESARPDPPDLHRTNCGKGHATAQTPVDAPSENREAPTTLSCEDEAPAPQKVRCNPISPAPHLLRDDSQEWEVEL